MRKAVHLLLAGSIALLVWFVSSGKISARTPSQEAPPVFSQVPDFKLTNAAGETVSRTDFNKPWIADFIFTKCSRQCPMLTGKMKALAAKLPEINLVSFTVDPSDTPGTLARYKKFNGAQWTFLTGESGEVIDLAVKGFKLAAAQGKKEFTHSRTLVLLDGKGFIRGYFDSAEDNALENLVAQAKQLGNASTGSESRHAVSSRAARRGPAPLKRQPLARGEGRLKRQKRETRREG